MVKTCGLLYVHHCYEHEGTASVWALPGVVDAGANDAPEPEEYVQSILVIDHSSKPDVMQTAEKIVALLNALGVASRLAVTADD